MAIGSVRISGQAQQTSNARVSSEAFGSGVATALSGLARTTEQYELSVSQLEAAQKRKRDEEEDFDVQTRWAQQQGEWNRAQQDAIQNAPVNGTGLTNARYETLRAEQEAFLEAVPERLRDKYRVSSTTAVENLTTNAYTNEYAIRNDYEIKAVSDMVGTLSADIIANGGDVQGALVTMESLIGTTGLSEASKVELLESATADLYAAEFQTRLVAAATSNAPAGPADGRNPVMPGLEPWQRAMLNTTAADESNGEYNIRYNGHNSPPEHFDDYSDHPRVFVARPDGRVSSAAGRYQFTATEWDRVAGILNLEDFSPMNQDRAALYLMEERFNAQIGAGEMTFRDIMTRGNDAQLLAVKDALGPTWEAFSTMNDQRFLNLFKGSNGVAGGGTGSSQVPDAWSDPRYESLPFEVRTAMAEAASRTTTAMAEAAATEREANADQLRAAIAAGQAGEREVNDAIAAGGINLKDRDDLYSQVSAEREARQEATRYNAAVSGSVQLPNTPENQSAALKSMQDSGVYSGLQQMDAGAQAQLTRGYAKTGVMPGEVTDLLTGMMNSSDPRQQTFGLSTLSQMQARSPNSFVAGMPREVVAAEAAWRVLNRYAGPGEEAAVLTQFNNWSDPNQRQMREAFKTEAEDSMKALSNGDILSDLNGGLMNKLGAALSSDFDLANLPVNPATLGLLRADYTQLYTQYYSMFGDEGKTREFVTDMISNNWGTDTVGGRNSLMYLAPNSPQSGYQPINGNYNWMREDILQHFDLPVGTELELLTDGQSAADAAANRPVSYVVTMQDDRGRTIPMMGDDGLPVRVRPTPAPVYAQVEQATVVSSNLQARRERLELEQMNAVVSGNTGRPEDREAAMARYEELTAQISNIDEQLKESTATAGLADESLEDLQKEVQQLTARRGRFDYNEVAARSNRSTIARIDSQLEELNQKIARFQETN